VHLDPSVALAGLIVGFVVGMTGMGGGALMTPILVLVFNVQPLAAVSSDLVASVVMKPIGASVHLRRRTVHWELVRWLAIGSVPFAFAGVFVLRAFGDADQLENTVKVFLGYALLLAASMIVLKGYLQARRRRAELAGHVVRSTGPIKVNVPLTILTGAIGGLVVGMTSVGSGSLIIVVLMMLYPALSGKELVGTDLVQAVPLVAAAALGHVLYGDFQLGLTASLLIGCLPGVYLGARVSSRAPDGIVRPALVFVLTASALKLLNMPTETLGIVLLVGAIVGLPLWGLVDAAHWSDRYWNAAGQSKGRWMAVQGFGAPVGIGFGAAIAYFSTTRYRLADLAATVAGEQSLPAHAVVANGASANGADGSNGSAARSREASNGSDGDTIHLPDVVPQPGG
jgi:hypothetical protein